MLPCFQLTAQEDWVSRVSDGVFQSCVDRWMKMYEERAPCADYFRYLTTSHLKQPSQYFARPGFESDSSRTRPPNYKIAMSFSIPMDRLLEVKEICVPGNLLQMSACTVMVVLLLNQSEPRWIVWTRSSILEATRHHRKTTCLVLFFKRLVLSTKRSKTDN